jgi:hypothetical protein
MDDMIFVHHDKAVLKETKKAVETFLSEKLHLTLHPDKVHIDDVQRGVTFLGHRIHPRGVTM